MFYAQFVLSKKGPLAKIWLAAHWEKKLSKAQIYETKVQDAVDEILKPKVKMALRTTGHLLLGIVRIYSRQAKYLLADCNEAFLKLKMAFRPGQVEISQDVNQMDSSHINLPDVFHDFDAALPDFNEFDFQRNLHVNQGRIDEITLREDNIPEANDFLFGDFGGDDFGERSFEKAEGPMTPRVQRSDMLYMETDDFAEVGADDFGERRWVDAKDVEASRVEVGRFSLDIFDGRRETSVESSLISDNLSKSLMPHDIDVAENPNIPEDFPNFNVDNGFDDLDGVFNDDELVKGFENIEASVVEQDVRMETDESGGGAVLNLEVAKAATGAVLADSFALEPLDASALAMAGMEKQARPKKKRRLIIDEQKNISGDEMKGNMADYSDTVQQLDLAPPTRRLMRLRELSSADRLYSNPGCSALRAPELLKLYRSNLVLRVRETAVVSSDDVRRDLEMIDHVDVNIEPEGSVVNGIMEDRVEEFEDVGIPLGSPGVLEPILEEEPASVSTEDVTASPTKDLFAGPERKRERRSRADKTIEEEDAIAEGEDDYRWNKRTQNVLNSISSKLKASADGEIYLSDLLTKNSTRKTAAQKFYTLLVLKKWQAIEVQQEEAFGDIKISAGPNIAGTAAA